MLDFSLAIAHHLLIFALFGILAAELIIVSGTFDAAALRRAAAIDVWYGVVAGLIVVAGFSRAIFAAKGWAYYEHNVYFWCKIGTFVLIALISAIPTVSFLRWQRLASPPDAAHVGGIRRLIWLQIALFALLPIFAAAMARGFGEIVRAG